VIGVVVEGRVGGDPAETADSLTLLSVLAIDAFKVAFRKGGGSSGDNS